MDYKVIIKIAAMLLSVELLFVKTGAQSGDDVNGVLTELFTTNGYNKKIRPLRNQTIVLNIAVEFFLSCKCRKLQFIHVIRLRLYECACVRAYINTWIRTHALTQPPHTHRYPRTHKSAQRERERENLSAVCCGINL